MTEEKIEAASLQKETKTQPLPPKKEKEKNPLRENLLTILYAIIIAVGIRTVWIEPFSIPSGSMIPTLEVGDYLFITKYSYGYSRYSLPFGMPLIKGRIFYEEPKVGDVVVFKLPLDNSTDYIKRVIGLPGDKIQVIQGRLHINDKMVERKEVRSTFTTLANGKIVPIVEYEETLPNGVVHPIYEISDNERFDNTEAFTVPAGHFFMMGDNRDNSLDSRYHDVGFVPSINLEGKAQYIFFSKTPEFAWWNVFGWLFDVRWSRIFDKIQ